MAINNGEKIFANPGQEYAEVPLNLYNVPDTEGITVAFKTDNEGAATLALLNANSDTYQSYDAVDAFVNLGKWEENPKGFTWGVPSSGTAKVLGSEVPDGTAFLTLYYNIPDEATVKSIAQANGLEVKQDAEHGTYYEFPLVFEREKLNNKKGKLLEWGGLNNSKIKATYVDSSICIPVTGVEPTTTTAVTTTQPLLQLHLVEKQPQQKLLQPLLHRLQLLRLQPQPPHLFLTKVTPSNGYLVSIRQMVLMNREPL